MGKKIKKEVLKGKLKKFKEKQQRLNLLHKESDQ